MFKERDSEKRSKESHNGRSDDISLWGRGKGHEDFFLSPDQHLVTDLRQRIT